MTERDGPPLRVNSTGEGPPVVGLGKGLFQMTFMAMWELSPESQLYYWNSIVVVCMERNWKALEGT